MDGLIAITGQISDFMYTYILVFLLIFCAIYFTIRTKGVQIRYIKDMFTQLTEKRHVEGKRSISSFQALMVSTASRVGTGNIAGIATAVATGGPGAVFWMWIMALAGAASAFVESTLAQIWKVRGKEGEFRGGPAYYIEQALGKRWVGVLFAVLLIICYAYGFNGLQAFNMASALEYYIPDYATNGAAVALGIVLVVMTAFVIFGGSKRISIITSIVVPVMAIAYIGLGLFITLTNLDQLPAVFAYIGESAFDFQSIFGGFAGSVVVLGIKRGLFSNEAGMGSTPHAHAMANVKTPHEQGVVAIIAVFVDTFVVVTITALTCIVTLYVGDGALAQGLYDGIDKTNMAQIAFGSLFGAAGGNIFVAICLLFFAFSTIISWNLFAKINIEYLFGKKAVPVFSCIALVFIFIGALLANDLVWELADMFNQLMVLPNAIALFALGGAVSMCAKTRGQKMEIIDKKASATDEN